MYFSFGPVPSYLIGSTLYVQAVALHNSLPGGVGLSTHGNPALPTPARRLDFVP